MVRSTHRLALWMNGDHVGVWVASPAGHELHYDAAWMRAPQGRPLSVSLPFLPEGEVHRGAPVSGWFDNLLPDNPLIRERLARRFGAASTRAADLLAHIGRDCVGALQILPEGDDPGDVRRIDAEPMAEADVARLLRGTRTPGLGGAEDPDDLRISIAGAQEKTALLWHAGQWWRPRGATPTTHIFKLPLGEVGPMRLNWRESVANEWLCAQILSAYGLPTARCHPLVFEDQQVLGVERFDRRWSDDNRWGQGRRWLWRLPQEDLCQATGTPPERKYEADGGPGIARVLALLGQSEQRDADRATFFTAQLLFWMLCAPDGHAKNFSIALRPGGRFALTPLYDVMSAAPLLGTRAGQISPQKIKLAMALRNKNVHWKVNEIQSRHWVDVGRRLGVVTADGRGVEALIGEVAAQTPGVVDAVSAALPKGFPQGVAGPILKTLLATGRRLQAV